MINHIEGRVLLKEGPVLDHPYDVLADGEKFLLVESEALDVAKKLPVVQDWFAEFRDREQD